MRQTASSLKSQPDLLARTTAAAPDDRALAAPRWPRALARGWKSQSACRRIGIYGLFGCGNLGNDGSLESMLIFLRQVRPDAELVCICAGPDHVAREFRLAGISIGFPRPSNSVLRVLIEGPRKLGSFPRAIWHARKLGLLIVAGGGVLEDFKEQSFGAPLTLFMWCLAARLCGVRIAFVSIGAGPIRQPIARWLLKSAAAMADYRSYRDTNSKAFMESIGFDTRGDEVYPDIAFKLRPRSVTPRQRTGDGPLTVGVGVMAYHGWLKRSTSAAVYTTYIEKLTDFVLWLMDQGHSVRMLIGDQVDWLAVDDLATNVAAARPDLQTDRLLAYPSYSLHDLMEQMAATDVVVATRFHNVVCALRLGKPIVSIGYGEKHAMLLAEMGLSSFCQRVDGLDRELLFAQFSRLIADRQRYAQSIQTANLAFQKRLDRQEELLAACFL